MKQRVDNIRQSVEEKYKLADQVIITTRRVQNSNMFEVIPSHNYSVHHKTILKVYVSGQLVHSKKKGNGYVDTPAKMSNVIRAVHAALVT